MTSSPTSASLPKNLYAAEAKLKRIISSYQNSRKTRDLAAYLAPFDVSEKKILKIQDCAVWYESKPEEAYDEEDLQLRLSQMQLFVMPVTTKLLTAPNRAMDVEFPFAQEKHIPVLPSDETSHRQSIC